ncbi:hypothetical protein LIT25_04000 [Bacillus sp. F19]|nr:hypothetical protein LIT25_04000 [Bacillus sp. F19]
MNEKEALSIFEGVRAGLYEALNINVSSEEYKEEDFEKEKIKLKKLIRQRNSASPK